MDTMPLVQHLLHGLLAGAGAAAAFTLALTAKALSSYTRAGPQLRAEVLAHFKVATALAIVRLALWTFAVALFLTLPGIVTCTAWLAASGGAYDPGAALAAGAGSLLLLTALQFCRHLLHIPSSIAASFQYRLSRLYGLWQMLTPGRLRVASAALAAALAAPLGAAVLTLLAAGRTGELGVLLAASGTIVGIGALATQPFRAGKPSAAQPGRMPNIVMLGADTLRADRIGALGCQRPLTPFIDALATRGTLFSNCYVPLARTAPSLVSLLTGAWPHRHGIRDNFVADDQTRLAVPSLARILRAHGYRSAAVSDWSGADLGKLDFGFDLTDTPADQWNLRYYLRQGPMDLRLFLSLFTHNRFGKHFLPELYYLAGVPLTGHLGGRTRELISDLAGSDQPFLLTLFSGATHVPFGSEHPYYTLFSDKAYRGESKFVMFKFTDPMEIVDKQEQERASFDLPQIMNLYDGCVRRFDDEVARICAHLQACGIADNTVLVVFSDHGTDFFENRTWGQGNTVIGSDPSARIPLLVLDPRRPGAGRVDAVTRSIDLLPTLLDLLGVDGPPQLDGRSLMPHLDGRGEAEPREAYQETGIWLGRVPGRDPEHLVYPCLLDLLDVPDKRTGTLAVKAELQDVVIEAKDRMVRFGRWKLVYLPLRRGARYLLFDVEADPACSRDLAPVNPEKVAELKARLIAWMTEDPGRVWIGEHLVPRHKRSPGLHAEPARASPPPAPGADVHQHVFKPREKVTRHNDA